MEISKALTAIRLLDSLPEPRRRYLCALAADARTDSERARIVLEARHEGRRVRTNLEADLKAEFADRARWAADNPERPAEAPQTPTGGRRWAEEGTTHAGARPVTITYGPITKTATEKQKQERRPLMGKNREYPSAPAPEGKVKTPYSGRTHGIVSTYNAGCKCDPCSAASAEHGRQYRARKKAEKHSAQSGDPAV